MDDDDGTLCSHRLDALIWMVPLFRLHERFLFFPLV